MTNIEHPAITRMLLTGRSTPERFPQCIMCTDSIESCEYYVDFGEGAICWDCVLSCKHEVDYDYEE